MGTNIPQTSDKKQPRKEVQECVWYNCIRNCKDRLMDWISRRKVTMGNAKTKSKSESKCQLEPSNKIERIRPSVQNTVTIVEDSENFGEDRKIQNENKDGLSEVEDLSSDSKIDK